MTNTESGDLSYMIHTIRKSFSGFVNMHILRSPFACIVVA